MQRAWKKPSSVWIALFALLGFQIFLQRSYSREMWKMTRYQLELEESNTELHERVVCLERALGQKVESHVAQKALSKR